MALCSIGIAAGIIGLVVIAKRLFFYRRFGHGGGGCGPRGHWRGRHGGGGYGPARARNRARVEHDQALGYVAGRARTTQRRAKER